MTTILDLPLVEIAVTAGTNEDWLDGIAFTHLVDEVATPLALSGIDFQFEVRKRAEDNDVWLQGSIADGRLTVGGDDHNVLSFVIPQKLMQKIPPGSYVFDVLAVADGFTRAVVRGDLTVLQGVTR